MAHISGIEHMPQDVVGGILTLVARQPHGAADIVRAFAACKTLSAFAEDEYLLRAISFRELFASLGGRYELLSQEGGLFDRCLRVQNSEAEILLSKVIMTSSTKLYNATKEAADHDVSAVEQSIILIGVYNLSDLDYFSAQNANPTVLFDLVRTFLSLAEVRDFNEIHLNLKDFVALYIGSGKRHQHQRFLAALDILCERKSRRHRLHPLTVLVKNFKTVCTMGLNLMENVADMDEPLFSPLRQICMQMNDNGDVTYETLIERLIIAHSVFKIGVECAVTDRFLTTFFEESISCIFSAVWCGLLKLMDQKDLVQSVRKLMLANFDDIFSLQQQQDAP